MKQISTRSCRTRVVVEGRALSEARRCVCVGHGWRWGGVFRSIATSGNLFFRALVLAVTALGMLPIQSLHAEGHSVYAVHTFSVAEEIDRSYTLLWSESGVEGVASNTLVQTSAPGEIVAVSRFDLAEQPKELRALMVVVGKRGGLSAITQGLQIESSSAGGIYSLSASRMREELQEAKASLSALESRRDRQGKELERIQRDADTIANIGRIIDAEDELGEVTSDMERLQQTLAGTQEQLSSLKTLPRPSNYAKRESELSAFLAEFGRIARDSEAEVFQKLEAAEKDMREKTALIEATKGDHIDLLQKELTALRREREALERSRQVVVHDATPRDVEDSVD
jgi:hypothetical protein